ncbi:uncharacterized protein LOC127473730 [Manacus candei]|uniref:uncharacterized protein LOC127473730 n=1 Tax=Manacus candei TaxID=415023 RepID=UPI002227C21B|nr:uncharacterized protein LOC127473730 [Manacus candei]XP_051649688.1 uncharacterized protein LOC127473730 [Manacus candei]XP_051649689.1 uncharacterized protein LOC127473730 [Manacus candei]
MSVRVSPSPPCPGWHRGLPAGRGSIAPALLCFCLTPAPALDVPSVPVTARTWHHLPIPLFKAGAGGRKINAEDEDDDDDDDGGSDRPWGQLAPRRRPRGGDAVAWHSRARGWELVARRLRFNASGQLANSRLARRSAGRGRACALSRRGPRCQTRLAPLSRPPPRGDGGQGRAAGSPCLPPCRGGPRSPPRCSRGGVWWGHSGRSAWEGQVCRDLCPPGICRDPISPSAGSSVAPVPTSAGTPVPSVPLLSENTPARISDLSFCRNPSPLCSPPSAKALVPSFCEEPCPACPTLVCKAPCPPSTEPSVPSSVGAPVPPSAGTPVPPSSKPLASPHIHISLFPPSVENPDPSSSEPCVPLSTGTPLPPSAELCVLPLTGIPVPWNPQEPLPPSQASLCRALG